MSIRLDIGCGSRKYDNCIGIDIEKSSDVDIIADATHLPIRDGLVDFIYSRECIQHIKDSDTKALSEMYRVLNSNGKLDIISSCLPGWFLWRIGISSKHYNSFTLYTDYLLRRKLRRSGFTNCDIAHIFLPNKFFVSHKLGLKIAYHDIIVVCHK